MQIIWNTVYQQYRASDFRFGQAQGTVWHGRHVRGHPLRSRGRLREASGGLSHPSAPPSGGDGGVSDRLPERRLRKEGQQQVQDAEQARKAHGKLKYFSTLFYHDTYHIEPCVSAAVSEYTIHDNLKPVLISWQGGGALLGQGVWGVPLARQKRDDPCGVQEDTRRRFAAGNNGVPSFKTSGFISLSLQAKYG